MERFTKKRQKKLRKVTQARNVSFLAHGVTPLKKTPFEKAYKVFLEFFEEAMTSLSVKVAVKSITQLLSA